MADRYDYDRERGYDRDQPHHDREREHAHDERWQRNRNDRGLMDRAGDEVRSWFGDDEAARRRQRDELREGRERGFGRSYEQELDRDYDRDVSRGYNASTRERGYAAGEDISRAGTSSRQEWPGTSRELGRSDWGSRSTGSFRGSEGSRGSQEGFTPLAYSYPAWSAIEPGPFTGKGPRGYQRSDDRIREDICDRLTRHGRIDATDITISVSNGEVTLQGIVDTRDAKRLAEDVAESVDGVRDVNNHLKTFRGGFDERSGQQGKTSTPAGETTSVTGTTAVGSLDKKR